MSLADEIRAYAYEHFVAPQLAAKGLAVVRASDVHKAMAFRDRFPAVCPFDLRLLGIAPQSLRFVVDGKLLATGYGQLEGQALRLPIDPDHRPAVDCLEYVWSEAEPSRKGAPVAGS